MNRLNSFFFLFLISFFEILFHIWKLNTFVFSGPFMVIIKKKTIADYCTENPRAAESLWNWYKQTKANDWSNFSEMKFSFNSVDAVGNDLYVFNIKGNHYRLIVRIIFKARTVYIKFIGTHKEYDLVSLESL